MPFALATVLAVAAVTASEVVRFPGACDASAAVMLGQGLVAVANDEDNVIRIYTTAGKPATEVSLKAALGSKEADIEGAVRVGSRSYWITSQGRNKNAELRPERRQFFAADVTGDGKSLVPGPITNKLFDALLAAPGLGELREASLKAPEAPGGLNIEGLAAGDGGELLIAFRNPLRGGRALVVALENPEETLRGEAARFQAPVVLDLGGLGIRSLERVGGRYLIVAGPTADEGRFRLFRWDRRNLELLSELSDLPSLAGLKPEALVEIGPGRVMLFSDDGSMIIEGEQCKDAPVGSRSFRGVEISFPP